MEKEFIENLDIFINQLKNIKKNYSKEYVDGNSNPIYDTCQSLNDNIERLILLSNVSA